MRELLPVEKVIGLARAGETFTLDATHCPTQDLLAIAAIAARSGARLRFRGLHDRPIEDLMRITVASEGRVVLEQAPVGTPQVPVRTGWFRRRTAREASRQMNAELAA